MTPTDIDASRAAQPHRRRRRRWRRRLCQGRREGHLEEESPGATILHHQADAQIGGKLAQLGSRLIDLTSRKLAANFFESFAAVVAPSS